MPADLVFRPLAAWTDPITDSPRPIRFSAAWTDTRHSLLYEVEQVAYRDSEVVLQVQADERAMRRDGGIRADAKVTGRGVVVSFESKYGPLRYACDTFESRYSGDMPSWQANVRAIALGLEALRTVSRYGIGQSGEQYRGWGELPAAAGDAPPIVTKLDAAKVLIEIAGHEWPDMTTRDIYGGGDAAKMISRSALRLTHPDTGGDRIKFDRVQQARQRLGLA